MNQEFLWFWVKITPSGIAESSSCLSSYPLQGPCFGLIRMSLWAIHLAESWANILTQTLRFTSLMFGRRNQYFFKWWFTMVVLSENGFSIGKVTFNNPPSTNPRSAKKNSSNNRFVFCTCSNSGHLFLGCLLGKVYQSYPNKYLI